MQRFNHRNPRTFPKAAVELQHAIHEAAIRSLERHNCAVALKGTLRGAMLVPPSNSSGWSLCHRPW